MELTIYGQVIDLIGACGNAIASITDGIKHLVETGATGYDYIAARREHKRLRDLSAYATNLMATSQVPVIRSIDEYLARPNPNELEWGAIRAGIAGVTEGVQHILEDVRKERSDFVLEETYLTIIETLHGRISLFDKILMLPQPKTEQEREALEVINTEYKRLLKEFRKAIQQLNLYLKQKKLS